MLTSGHTLGSPLRPISLLAIVTLSITLPSLAQSQVTGKLADPPLLTDCSPSEGAPGTNITLHGYRLFVGKPDNAAVIFVRGGDHVSIKQYGAGGFANNESNMIQYFCVAVPKDLGPGKWHVVVEVDGRVSAPIDFKVTGWKPPVLRDVRPGWAGPGTTVFAEAEAVNVNDRIELTDARGVKQSVELFTNGAGAVFTVPGETADGTASLRIVNGTASGASNSMSILISRGPLPIDLRSSGQLLLGRGQWLSLPTPPNEFDKHEIAFICGTDTIVEPIEPGYWGVRIPLSVEPGPVQLSTRAWRGGVPSFWSDPKPYTVLDTPAPTVIRFIRVSSEEKTTGNVSLAAGPEKPESFDAAPGNELELMGTMPLGHGSGLRLSLQNGSELVELKPAVFPIRYLVTFKLPPTLGTGDWQMVLRNREDGSFTNIPITMHVTEVSSERSPK